MTEIILMGNLPELGFKLNSQKVYKVLIFR